MDFFDSPKLDITPQNYSNGNGKPAGDVFRIGKYGQEADDLDAEFERY